MKKSRKKIFLSNEVRVAVYARVSTEHEAQIYALGNQVDWFSEIIASQPHWNLTKYYIDKGITGTMATKRPQFMKMIAAAQKKEFDLIITREVSRFARNTLDTLQYTRMLREYGVEVFFLCDNIRTSDPDCELRLSIMAMLAQDESRKTSDRVKSGIKTAQEKGVFYGTGNILGYNRVGRDLVINEEQAKTVRMMFDQYLAGQSLSDIAKNLEKAGRLTATGKTNWHPGTVGQVLENSFYCGIITYGKSYVGNYLDQKRKENHGEIEQLQVRGSHTPIITEEEYQLAQKIRATRRLDLDASNKRHPLGCRLTHSHLIGNLLYCRCGSSVHIAGGGPSEPFSLAYRCVRADKSYCKRKKKAKDNECDNISAQICGLKSSMNYIFSTHMGNASYRKIVAAKLVAKNERLSGSMLNDTDRENEIGNVCELLKRIHDECMTQNITDDSMSRIIEKIIYYKNEVSIFLGYNKHPNPLFQFVYDQDAYKKLLREELLTHEMTKEELKNYYFPAPEERHKWKAVSVTVII